MHDINTNEESNTAGLVHFLDLPNELVGEILKNVSVDDLPNVALVCQRMRELQPLYIPTVLWRDWKLFSIVHAATSTATPMFGMCTHYTYIYGERHRSLFRVCVCVCMCLYGYSYICNTSLYGPAFVKHAVII